MVIDKPHVAMQFEQAQNFILQKLEKELPRYLRYHNADHTRQVAEAVKQLAVAEGITGEEKYLLYTAALFHDAGFLLGYDEHEELSCRVARDFLHGFDYTPEQVDRICELILATKLPQQPADLSAKVLCDADLSYLGTDHFEERAGQLYKEWKAVGIVKDWKQWQRIQAQFLKSHHYFTKTANQLYAFEKSRNIAAFMAKRREGKVDSKPVNYSGMMQDFFFTVIGVITAGFALKGFLVPNHFFDGGITGISLLVHEIYGFNLSVTTIVLNLPFIAASYYVVSRRFALRTLFTVMLLGICLLFFPYPIITSDKLLISIFGGFFLGVGSGLAMRGGSALDGIEVLALYTLKRTSFTISEIILAINILIFGIAAFRFGIETALYSILTYYTASKTIDFVVEGIEAYTGVTIISGHSEIIKNRLVNELGRSITIYKGERGYLPGNFHVSSSCDIVFTVVSRLELRKLKNLVHETDPNAFVFANTIREASGGVIKHRHVHH